MSDIEGLLKQQGEAFDAFKGTMTEIQGDVKKLGSADSLLADRLGKIENALDKAVEGKAAIDAAVKAEVKAREELELKLGRMNLTGHSKESAIREVEIKTFNDALFGLNAVRGQAFTPLDGKGYDDYKAAQVKFIRSGEKALNADEFKTMSVGSDPAGGYWVTPDVSGKIVSKVFETSPVRQFAGVQTISTDVLEGIEDINEAGAGYAGETAQGSDTTTPNIGKWKIPVFWIDTEPKTTQQLLDDSMVDVEAWLANKVADKFSRFENAEFVTGAANRILGFAGGYTFASDTGSGVTWGTLGYTGTGVSADFPASNPGDFIHTMVGLLKNAYLGNARWITRRSVITKIRKFKVGTGDYLWQPSFVAGQPETIAGYPVARMEDMPALAASSYSLAFGDLAQAYQIVDRQGIRVIRDNLTSKPYVKFYTAKRTGGGVLNFEAVKFAKFI